MESRRIPINGPVAVFFGITAHSARSVAQAAMIDNCILGSVTVDPPSDGGYVIAEAYGSTVYTNTTRTNGVML